MGRIYFAEDDEYLTRVYERAFRFAGHEIEILQDGAKALDAISKADPLPSVVILDILLPVMSGFDILTVLRKDTRLDGVPIAILTNSFVEGDREKFLSSGADIYMVKIENEPKDVVEKISALIKIGRVKRS